MERKRGLQYNSVGTVLVHLQQRGLAPWKMCMRVCVCVCVCVSVCVCVCTCTSACRMPTNTLFKQFVAAVAVLSHFCRLTDTSRGGHAHTHTHTPLAKFLLLCTYDLSPAGVNIVPLHLQADLTALNL